MSSEASFEAAFDGLFGVAFGVARRLLGSATAAEDVAAETLTRAYVRWRTIGDKDWLEAWVVRVATNVALDVYRRESRRAKRTAPPSPHGVDSFGEGPLASAVSRLPRRQQQVVALRYLADLSESQVADALGLSLGSVRTHLRRGLSPTARHGSA